MIIEREDFEWFKLPCFYISLTTGEQGDRRIDGRVILDECMTTTFVHKQNGSMEKS